MTITEVIALIALLLSLFSIYLQWFDKYPRLTIMPRIAKGSLPTMSGERKGSVFSINAYNTSATPVHIKEVWLSTNKFVIKLYDYNALYSRVFSPFTIEPHRDKDMYVQTKELLEDLKKCKLNRIFKAKIILQDETHRKYKSKNVTIDTKQLLFRKEGRPTRG